MLEILAKIDEHRLLCCGSLRLLDLEMDDINLICDIWFDFKLETLTEVIGCIDCHIKAYC